MEPEEAAASSRALKTAEGRSTSSTTAAATSRCRRTRRRLRLELRAPAACRPSGRIGFEIFDRTAFGATEFLEQVNYRRALEGEIARTIATHRRSGERARPHRDGARTRCSSRAQPAKASVVLKLKQQPAARRRRPSPASPTSWPPASKACGPRRSSSSTASAGRWRGRATTATSRSARRAARAPAADRARAGRRASSRCSSRSSAPSACASTSRCASTPSTRGADRRALRPDHGRPQPAGHARRQRPPAARGASPARAATCPAPAPPAPTGDAGHAAGAAGRRARRPARTRSAETDQLRGRARRRAHTVQPRGDIARLSVAVILDDDHRSKTDARGQGDAHVDAAHAGRDAEDPGARRGRRRPRPDARRSADRREHRVRRAGRRSRSPRRRSSSGTAADAAGRRPVGRRARSSAWSRCSSCVRPIVARRRSRRAAGAAGAGGDAPRRSRCRGSCRRRSRKSKARSKPSSTPSSPTQLSRSQDAGAAAPRRRRIAERAGERGAPGARLDARGRRR